MLWLVDELSCMSHRKLGRVSRTFVLRGNNHIYMRVVHNCRMCGSLLAFKYCYALRAHLHVADDDLILGIVRVFDCVQKHRS